MGGAARLMGSSGTYRLGTPNRAGGGEELGEESYAWTSASSSRMPLFQAMRKHGVPVATIHAVLQDASLMWENAPDSGDLGESAGVEARLQHERCAAERQLITQLLAKEEQATNSEMRDAKHQELQTLENERAVQALKIPVQHEVSGQLGDTVQTLLAPRGPANRQHTLLDQAPDVHGLGSSVSESGAMLPSKLTSVIAELVTEEVSARCQNHLNLTATSTDPTVAPPSRPDRANVPLCSAMGMAQRPVWSPDSESKSQSRRTCAEKQVKDKSQTAACGTSKSAGMTYCQCIDGSYEELVHEMNYLSALRLINIAVAGQNAMALAGCMPKEFRSIYATDARTGKKTSCCNVQAQGLFSNDVGCSRPICDRFSAPFLKITGKRCSDIQMQSDRCHRWSQDVCGGDDQVLCLKGKPLMKAMGIPWDDPIFKDPVIGPKLQANYPKDTRSQNLCPGQGASEAKAEKTVKLGDSWGSRRRKTTRRRRSSIFSSIKSAVSHGYKGINTATGGTLSKVSQTIKAGISKLKRGAGYALYKLLDRMMPKKLKPFMGPALKRFLVDQAGFVCSFLANAEITRNTDKIKAFARALHESIRPLLLKQAINPCDYECYCEVALDYYFPHQYYTTIPGFNNLNIRSLDTLMADFRRNTTSEHHGLRTYRISFQKRLRLPVEYDNMKTMTPGELGNDDPASIACEMYVEFSLGLCSTCCCDDGVVTGHVDTMLSNRSRFVQHGNTEDAHGCQTWFTGMDGLARAAVSFLRASAALQKSPTCFGQSGHL